jgi:hypothetical protein
MKKMLRSFLSRRGRCGQSWNIVHNDHPVCAASERELFLDGAATPPVPGGEPAHLIRVLLVILLGAATCAAQGYTQRGFLENRATLYPQTAPNDRARAVGESLFRYEAFYQPSTVLQFNGAVDFRLDTHHQVERDLKLSWQDREQQRPTGEIRRLSAMYHKGPVTFEVGKQFVRWGKTDIVAPTDRFAPRDFLTVVDNDLLPITAARLTLEKGANTVDLVWSPRLTPSRIPLPNQRWAVPPDLPRGVSLHDAGVEFPGGPQSGVRWNHVGAIEYGLSLYQGFNHMPSFDASPRFMPTGVQVDVSRFYPKMLMAGGDIAIPTRWLTIKGEAAHFSSSDPRGDEFALYVVQLERQSGEWFFVGGYAGEATTREGTQAGDFAPDRGLTKTLLGRSGYTIDANRSIAFEAAVRQNGDGTWTKFEDSHAIGQHWRATANLTVIRGDVGDFLGQYRRNSHAILVVRYSF